jgi:hypothetical protein
MTTADHPYLHTVQRPFGPERVFDMARFAADLAPLIGAAVAWRDDCDPHNERPRLERNDGLVLYPSSPYHVPAGRVRIGIGAPEIERRLKYRPDKAKFGEITLDASRPLDKIAADVRRRLIEPAALPLAAFRLALAEQDADRARCEAHVAAICERFPNVSAKFADERDTQATLYANGGGAFLSARLCSDGGLYVDRVGGVGADRAMAFIAALCGPVEG